jgi:hypothetical protein
MIACCSEISSQMGSMHVSEREVSSQYGAPRIVHSWSKFVTPKKTTTAAVIQLFLAVGD